MKPQPAYTLTDPATGTDYLVFLEVPPVSEPGPHPAVLFLDGDDQFRFAVDAYRAARAAGEVAPLVLVGLGYGASYMKPGNWRVRDYTPAALPTEAESGGAEGFRRFLTHTFWPDLARRVPVRNDVRGIAGHSLGSLFVLHALWQEKPFFTHHLASAPSLWWADRAILCDAQNLQRKGVALPAKLYLSVGEEDSTSMTGDLALLEDQLAALPFPQLAVTSQRFPGKNHFDVLPDAFGAGLRALFPG